MDFGFKPGSDGGGNNLFNGYMSYKLSKGNMSKSSPAGRAHNGNPSGSYPNRTIQPGSALAVVIAVVTVLGVLGMILSIAVSQAFVVLTFLPLALVVYLNKRINTKPSSDKDDGA